MATLTEFLTNIANAIRSKKGTTEPINAQNFATEIESIETGSGGGNTLKQLLDLTKHTKYLFSMFPNTSVDTLISYNDTENVTDMSYMFSGAASLTSIPLLNTTKVTTMQAMFSNCTDLSQIPSMDTSAVTNMSSMFSYCSLLKHIPLLNTSNVLDMSSMFSNSDIVSIPELDTSNVTKMSYMFNSCTMLKDSIKINTDSVKQMSNMFYNCLKLKGVEFSSLDNLTSTSSATNMFHSCYSLTKIIIRNMSKIPYFNSNAFTNCYHFTGTKNSTYNPEGLKDGKIYVPDDYVDQLKASVYWSAYADCIVPLSSLEE